MTTTRKMRRSSSRPRLASDTEEENKEDRKQLQKSTGKAKVKMEGIDASVDVLWNILD